MLIIFFQTSGALEALVVGWCCGDVEVLSSSPLERRYSCIHSLEACVGTRVKNWSTRREMCTKFSSLDTAVVFLVMWTKLSHHWT